jgi:hypothetical protein
MSKKLSHLSLSVVLAGLLSVPLPTISFAADICPSDPSQLAILLDQVTQDEQNLSNAKTSLEDLKRQLFTNGVKRVLLYSGTTATAAATAFHVIFGTYGSIDSGEPIPGKIKSIIGLELIADAGMIYLDIQNAHARDQLKSKIKNAEIQIVREQTTLENLEARIANCQNEAK